MWMLLLLSVCMAQPTGHTCDIDLNSAEHDYLNPTCNYVGVCLDWTGDYNSCECCKGFKGNSNLLDQKGEPLCSEAIVGIYDGKNCKSTTHFTSVQFGILVTAGDVTCPNDGDSSSVPNLLTETEALLESYPGLIVSLDCVDCSVSACDFRGRKYHHGIHVRFGTDLNSYYDNACFDGSLPSANVVKCAANRDYGIQAYQSIREALDEQNDFKKLLEKMNSIGDLSVTQAKMSELLASVTITRTGYVTQMPTSVPSPSPTSMPSPSPTNPQKKDFSLCYKFSNRATDLQFLDVGVSCRANIKESWPGGRGCESPYIVCLPQENTPAGEFLGREYYSNTHRYSVDECKKECALDQRCLGFEFSADIDSSLGNCSLIDDIPIAAVGANYDVKYTPNDTNLYESLDGNVLCFEKRDYCNPHFTSDDLNATMLTCYCPNNRKGSYTKKVKRTVSNTRSCGGDHSMDERIKYAQANRMFHLCENWCLFNVLNPELESWYWDPWKLCWRESYAARGEHRGYCDRVIRNPDSIELKFVNARSENILSCNVTSTPTQAPVNDVETTYFLGLEYESCDEACSRYNRTCAANQTARVFPTLTGMQAAFEEAGHTCDPNLAVMDKKKYKGWALPGLRAEATCVNRVVTFEHLEDLDSDCNRVVGKHWQRLCACY